MADDPVTTRIDTVLAGYTEELETLPQEARQAALRAIGVLASFGDDIPDELAEAIARVSVYGADPGWQLKALTEILDRWAPRQ